MMQFSRQFIKFGLVGFLSFIIDAGFYLLFTRAFGLFYLSAKIISFILAVTNSYFFNRLWTFRSKNLAKKTEYFKFLLVSVIGLGLNSLIMYLAVDKIELSDILALIISTSITMFWNFSANKFWTFKEKMKTL